jgi:predicted MPP superfamily phosphohydrolase
MGIDLQLSGHTHGGQMWPLRYLVPLQQPSVQGLDKVGNTVLYTTRGAGAWGPPVRVGAPPEITVLELVRER